MNWARAVKGNGTRVFRGSVALMILQSVGGVKRGEFRHGAIPRDLGDDRRGGDGRAARVAIDNGEFRAGETGFLIAVDQAQVRLHPKSFDRAAHRKQAGAKNIMRLDFLDGRDADGPAYFRVSYPTIGAEFFAPDCQKKCRQG